MPRPVYIDYSKYYKAKLYKQRRKYYKRRDKVWRAIAWSHIGRGLTHAARLYASSSYFPRTNAFRNEQNLWERTHTNPSIFGINPYRPMATYEKLKREATQKLDNGQMTHTQWANQIRRLQALERGRINYEKQRKAVDEEYFKQVRKNKKIDDASKWGDLGLQIGTAVASVMATAYGGS